MREVYKTFIFLIKPKGGGDSYLYSSYFQNTVKLLKNLYLA